jgi:hypothetical protein
MPYLSDKQRIKREPEIAAARAELCEMYRKVRRTDHRIARLLYRRMNNAVDALINHLFYDRDENQIGGLQEFFGP